MSDKVRGPHAHGPGLWTRATRCTWCSDPRKQKGKWSFKHPGHEKKIRAIIAKFSKRHGVRIHWFWDYRPFTRIVQSFKAFLNLRDYIHINRLEGFGYDRGEAKWVIASGSGRGG